MSVYSILIEKVKEGKNYKIDLKNKSLKIGRKYYIKEGDVCVEDNLINEDDMQNLEIDFSKEHVWDVLEWLYFQFKHSVPNENYHKKSYFKALKVTELDDGELAFNESRNIAQAMLEGFILLASLNQWLKWEFDKKWFWQSSDDKNLIVMKEWIE